MARSSFLSRLRSPSEPTPETPTPASPEAPQRRPRRRLPPAGTLRRERRMLLRAREDRIRDLGGLVFEMYRRDDYRQELVDEQCAALAGLEERLEEVETLLAIATGARPQAPPARCACGAPVHAGSRFCANCGRPLAAAVIACAGCSGALAPDARFCAVCGTPVGAPVPGANGEADA